MKVSTLCIDMSPSLVNKTALLDLPNTFKVSLEKYFNINTKYFGRSIESIEALRCRENFINELGIMLANPKNYKIKNDQYLKDPCIYLDPLYVLFDKLSKDDSVLILDISPITNPAWHRSDVVVAYRLAYQKIVEAGVNCYFISENTRITFNYNYSMNFSSANVIHLYLPEKRETLNSESRFPFPYFLFVGSLEKRKNIAGAIESFKISGLEKSGYKLIIIGGHGHGSDEIPKEYFCDSNVVFTGYISDQEINTIYSYSSGLLYLSYLEGFGVPLVEAMHHGMPIIASETSAIPEVLGGVGILVNPDDHFRVASEMNKIAHMSDANRKKISVTMKNRVKKHFSKNVFENNLIKAIKLKYQTGE